MLFKLVRYGIQSHTYHVCAKLCTVEIDHNIIAFTLLNELELPIPPTCHSSVSYAVTRVLGL